MTRPKGKPFALVAAVLVCGLAATRTDAQSAPPAEDPIAAAIAAAAQSAQRSDPPAALQYANRRITELRATVLSRPPATRAVAAAEALDRLAAELPEATVASRAYDGGTLITVGNRPVFVLLAADVDPIAGEAMETKVSGAIAQLSVAFREAVEMRSPRRLLPGILVAVAATILYIFLMWGLLRLDTRVAVAAGRAAERRLQSLPGGEVILHVRAPLLVRRLLNIVGLVLALFFTYSWLTVVCAGSRTHGRGERPSGQICSPPSRREDAGCSITCRTCSPCWSSSSRPDLRSAS